VSGAAKVRAMEIIDELSLASVVFMRVLLAIGIQRGYGSGDCIAYSRGENNTLFVQAGLGLWLTRCQRVNG